MTYFSVPSTKLIALSKTPPVPAEEQQSRNSVPFRMSTAQQELSHDVSSRFGQRVRELRVARHMTQAQMAKIFGIDRSFISDLERGRKTASLQTLEVIALGMKVTLSDLMREL